MKRLSLVFLSFVMFSGFLIGCASNGDENGGESNKGKGAEALGITLRSHDYDKSEEVIEDLHDRDQFVSIQGQNLTLPTEFPSDFPIPEGVTAKSTLTRENKGSYLGDLEVWFTDHGLYSIEQLNSLYTHYLESSGFDNIEIKDLSIYLSGLTSIEGTRNGELYVIGINPEDGFNHVTLSVYTDEDY